MTFILEFLAPDRQPVWSGMFRSKEDAYDYVSNNIEYLDQQGYVVCILFRQDREYRIFYENAAFLEDGEDDEESKKEEC